MARRTNEHVPLLEAWRVRRALHGARQRFGWHPFLPHHRRCESEPSNFQSLCYVRWLKLRWSCPDVSSEPP